MSAATDAYDRLSIAMDDTVPDCAGIDLFTADTLAPADVEVLAQICAGCPLLAVCDDYGRAARPPAGFWAGVQYTKPARRKTS